MSSNVRQPPRQAEASRQAVFVICPSGLRTVLAVVDEIEDQFAAQGIPATILLYGVSMKRREGFLLAQSARSIPLAFMRWLNEEQDILDYVVYDGALCEQEGEYKP